MEQDHVSSKALNPSALAVKTQNSNLGWSLHQATVAILPHSPHGVASLAGRGPFNVPKLGTNRYTAENAKSEEEALLGWSWSLAIQARITSITTQLHTICGQRPKHVFPQKIDSVQFRPPHHPQPSAPLPKPVCHSITEVSIRTKNITHPKKTLHFLS